MVELQLKAPEICSYDRSSYEIPVLLRSTNSQMVRTATQTVAKFANYLNTQRFLGAFVAIWLTAGYLLPNTVFAMYSAQATVPCLFIASTWILSKIFALFIGVLSCIASASLIHKNLFKYAVLAVFILFTATFCITIVGSSVVDAKISRCYMVLASTSCGLLAAWFCGSTKHAIIVLCTTVCVQASYVFMYYLTGIDHFISGDVLRASGSFESPAALYKVLVVALPLCFSLAVISNDTRLRVLWIIGALIVLVSLVLTWYRGGIVGASIALLLVVCRLKTHKRLKILVVVIAFFVTGLIFAARVHNVRSANSSRRSISSRLYQAHAGWRMFCKHPVFGVGCGAVEIFAKVGVGEDAPIATMAGPPNQLLFALTEGGVVELAGLVAFLGSCFVIGSRMRSPLGWGLSASWVGLAVCGIADIAFGGGNSILLPINCAVGMLTGATLMANDDTELASTGNARKI